MAIVYYTNPETKVKYAYDSVPKWDPVRKQSRPIKKYLGRVDPITGEIVASSGRRGRRKKSEDPMNDPNIINRDYKLRYEMAQNEVDQLTVSLKEARERIGELERQMKRANGIFDHLSMQMQQALQVQ